MLSPVVSAPQGFAELFDATAVMAELEGLTALHAGRERELRTAVAHRLKAALQAGRAAAERLLLRDRRGRLCAERLCFMQDEIIRILFEFTRTSLSRERHVGSPAHGGGRDRGLRPRDPGAGSDIDLLFLLPYKQTAWGE